MALYRPGPLNSGMVDDFIAIRNGEKEPSYIHPLMEDSLKETYGLMVYQEQIMQCASVLANFSKGTADMLRRAIGKKKAKDLKAAKTKFINGCLDNEEFLKFKNTFIANETIQRFESKVEINGEEKIIPAIEAFNLYMSENNIPEEKKESALISFTVFTLIEKFADYGFNTGLLS